MERVTTEPGRLAEVELTGFGGIECGAQLDTAIASLRMRLGARGEDDGKDKQSA
jgi:hypothetical protein